MELAGPSVAAGFTDCVRNGATEVIAFPYMLSPGKHVTRDVPRLVSEAAQAFPHVSYRVTHAFGVRQQHIGLSARRDSVELSKRVATLGTGRSEDNL